MTLSSTQKIGMAAGLAVAANALIAHFREEDLTGHRVLVTGGSRGLGLSLARAFGSQGCQIALCARDSEELLRAKDDLSSQGINAKTFPCDLRSQTDTARMIADVTAEMGGIDILVNNAGIISVGPLENLDIPDFEDAMATDFWGMVYPSLAVLPQMRARKHGHIVNITSIGGKLSIPHLLPYSCAKFAATGFSEGLRTETARDGVVVTTIVPGLLRTGSFLHALFKGSQAGEYTWFSVSDNIPGQSLSAEAAANAIVQATRRGEAERVLGLPAQIAAKAQGIAPGMVASISALVNRVLPSAKPGTGDVIKSGAQVHDENPSSVRDGLTTLGFQAARDLNES